MTRPVSQRSPTKPAALSKHSSQVGCVKWAASTSFTGPLHQATPTLRKFSPPPPPAQHTTRYHPTPTRRVCVAGGFNATYRSPSPSRSNSPEILPIPNARATHHALHTYSSTKNARPRCPGFQRCGKTKWCVSWSLRHQSDLVRNALHRSEIFFHHGPDHFTHPTLHCSSLTRGFAAWPVSVVPRSHGVSAHWLRYSGRQSVDFTQAHSLQRSKCANCLLILFKTLFSLKLRANLRCTLKSVLPSHKLVGMRQISNHLQCNPVH
jgi:hypothetical protein